MMTTVVALFFACVLLFDGVQLAIGACTICKITSGPDNITVISGQQARLNCRIEVDIYHTVDWNIGGLVHGPWSNPEDSMPGYTYPDDNDISLGMYDLIIEGASWKKHNNMKFRCQIAREFIGSNFATVTVIVPPDLTIIPTVNGSNVIEISSAQTEVEIACLSNYATPKFEVKWLLDGLTSIGLNALYYKTHKRGGKLMQLNSSIVIDSGRAKSNTVYHEPKPRKFYRKYLEKRYRVVYHVTCQIVNSEWESKRKEMSAWVVFKRNRTVTIVSHHESKETSKDWYYVLIGGTTLIIITMVVVVIIIWRRRPTQRSSQISDDKDYGFTGSDQTTSRCSDGAVEKGSSQHPCSPFTLSTTVPDVDETFAPWSPSPSARQHRKFDKRNVGLQGSSYLPRNFDGLSRCATVARHQTRYRESARNQERYRMQSLMDRCGTYRDSRFLNEPPSYYSPWSMPTSTQYEELNFSIRRQDSLRHNRAGFCASTNQDIPPGSLV